MNTKGILVLTGIMSLGFLFFGLAIGWEAAWFYVLVGSGAMLLYSGFGIILGMVQMHADETLVNMQTKRQAERQVDMIYHARDRRDAIENGKNEEIRIID